MGVSEKEETCQAAHCAKNGQPLVKCSCENGAHPGLITACTNCGKLCKEKGGCAVEPYKEELKG